MPRPKRFSSSDKRSFRDDPLRYHEIHGISAFAFFSFSFSAKRSACLLDLNQPLQLRPNHLIVCSDDYIANKSFLIILTPATVKLLPQLYILPSARAQNHVFPWQITNFVCLRCCSMACRLSSFPGCRLAESIQVQNKCTTLLSKSKVRAQSTIAGASN